MYYGPNKLIDLHDGHVRVEITQREEIKVTVRSPEGVVEPSSRSPTLDCSQIGMFKVSYYCAYDRTVLPKLVAESHAIGYVWLLMHRSKALRQPGTFLRSVSRSCCKLNNPRICASSSGLSCIL